MASKLLLGALSLMIVASIIGVLWFPLFAGLPSGNVLPREASQWHIGKGGQYDPMMEYQISYNGTKFSVKIEFLPETTSGNQTLFVQINPNTNEQINQTVPINLVYHFNQVSEEAKPYFDVMDSTIFSIGDYALENRYLVTGAVWGNVFIGASHNELKVIEHDKTSFLFGPADAFVVAYKIGDKENKFWIVDNLPLPVKSEVYDLSGNLLYSYELTSLSAPLTPGFNK